MSHPCLPRIGLLVMGALAGAICTAQPPASPDPWVLHPEFSITLFAKEPDVVDPVAIAFDEFNRAYVVEMRDYPTGITPDNRPGGTIRLLEDTDGDGRCDRSTLFAKNLSYPTSVLPYRGGVFVTAPPHILFLKDTDGDGVADQREVWFDGFERGVTDSNVNGLRLGLDLQIHGANGGNGGLIKTVSRSTPSVPLRNLDFAFDPETRNFSTTFSTAGGFGIVFDTWGHSFSTYNIDHIQQRVFPQRYLDRFPGLPPHSLTVSISDHGEAARIFPTAPAQTRVNHPEQAGHFSAAGGVGMLNFDLLPGDLAGSFTVCDVVGNLVHRDVLSEDGPIFKASRAASELRTEFFAAKDPAFRPVALELGPDDAFYLLDMQRDVIEHPDYIPAKVKQRLNLRAGEDRGRVYRLVSRHAPKRPHTVLGQGTPEQWIATLTDPNAWRRHTAQRLILEHAPATAAPLLRKLLQDRTQPVGQVHALWTLEGLHSISEQDLLDALDAAHPGVRENAVSLAERRVPASSRLSEALLAKASDPHPRVRLQTALSLGALPEPLAKTALVEILSRDVENRWTRLAVLSSIRGDPETIARALAARFKVGRSLPPTVNAAFQDLADLSAARATVPAQIQAWFAMADPRSEPGVDSAMLEGLSSGLARNTHPIPPDAALGKTIEAFFDAESPRSIASALRLADRLGYADAARRSALAARAGRRALDPALGPDDRSAWIRVVGLCGLGASLQPLETLIESNPGSPLQQAALEALDFHVDPRIPAIVMRHWRTLSPAARATALNMMLKRRSYHGALLEALEASRLTVGELNLDLEQRRRLLRGGSLHVQQRAAKFFNDEEYGHRKTLVDQWLARLPATGNPARGRLVFQTTCAGCHASGAEGHAVGPDLTDLSHRSVEDLASNILDPNMAIQPNYVAYSAELNNGESATGILEAESSSSVTLLQPQGVKTIIPRGNIRSLRSSGISLMPEGLEAGLTPESLRDLISFLQQPK